VTGTSQRSTNNATNIARTQAGQKQRPIHTFLLMKQHNKNRHAIHQAEAAVHA
jgi:hypothetical protein